LPGVNSTNLFPILSLTQGIYYLATGIWPLLSPKTFQMVTGPKTDVWLVKTVGVLVAVIGGVLTLAGLRRQTTREVPLLAAGAATGLAAIDVVYAARGRIGKIYLLDAAAEIGLALAWLFVRRRGRSVPVMAEIFRRRDTTERAAGPERMMASCPQSAPGTARRRAARSRRRARRSARRAR
jgi:hypothetical protein